MVLALAGCSASPGEQAPDPGPAAEELATALAAGDVASAPWAPGAAAEAAARYPAIVEGMGEVTPTVRVAELGEPTTADTGPASATATLAWTWPLGEQEWSYATQAPLTLEDGEWRADWSPSLVEPSLRGAVVLDATPVAAARGDIAGAGDRLLVTDRPVVRFGIDRTQVEPARAGESARRLARLLDLDPAAYARRVEAAGEEAFVEALVLRRDDVTSVAAFEYSSIEGARAIEDERALAPTPEFAAPILGRVGEVTAEMIEEDPGRFRIGDVAGLSGLEARYDEQLTGTPGLVVNARATDGRERELYRAEPTPGLALRTTLDLDLQLAAERLLRDVGPASALVAIRPSSGNIVAAANGPGTGGVNIATYGQAAPGSTFKAVSSLALLRAGLTPDSTVPCPASIVVDGRTFTNYDDYPPGGLGRIPLRTALANSCNTAFISQAGRLDRTALAGAAASLGFGIDHDLGFPAYFGQITPTAAGTEAAAQMIGQGTILASPMAMATVIASVQAGRTVVPRLVTSVDVAVPPAAAPLTDDEAALLATMLRGVVTTGSGALLADVPGPPVIAKTGTAEFDQDGRRLTHAWMVAAQGDLAVAVYVDVGDSGSGTAGPVLEGFLRAAR